MRISEHSGGDQHYPHAVMQEKPEKASPEQYSLKIQAEIVAHLANLVTVLADYSRPVDEYVAKTLAPDAETVLTVPAQFSIQERITSVFVAGPANANVTVQIGDRVFPVIIPASGFISVGPLSMLVGPNDARQLTTSGAAGQFFMELMGWADERY